MVISGNHSWLVQERVQCKDCVVQIKGKIPIITMRSMGTYHLEAVLGTKQVLKFFALNHFQKNCTLTQGSFMDPFFKLFNLTV